jgi:dTDP-glucose 4,6-dehydratase
MAKTILITGGAGFIGSNYIHYHRGKNSEDVIINLDILTYAGNLDNLTSFEEDSKYFFIKGSICDVNLVEKICAGSFDQKIPKPDLIIHFAAESHVDRSIEGPTTFTLTNVIGTQVLLEAARKNGNIRFHHISTDEVFGSLGRDGYFNELTPYDPRSPYAASKAASDHLVRAYHHTYNLPVTISNCSNNYGPFHHPEKLIPLFITNLLQNKKVPLYGDGQNIRDWLFVEDHCSAIDLIIQNGTIGETYCVGGNNEKTNLQIAHLILKSLNKDQDYIEYVKDRPGHDRRYAIDALKIEEDLGWKPSVTFEQGLEKTIQWYNDNMWWWEKLVNKYVPQNVQRSIGKIQNPKSELRRTDDGVRIKIQDLRFKI